MDSETEVEYAEIRGDAGISPSKALALRILGSRSMSFREIEKRLIGKGESEETARQTAQWLEDIGAIDDKEFAESIVRHYSSKGYGLARIKDELYKRGIDREMWEEALESLEGMEDAAYDFIVKKLKGDYGKDELRRVSDALLRRGFSYEETRAAVKKYIETIEETKDAEL